MVDQLQLPHHHELQKNQMRLKSRQHIMVAIIHRLRDMPVKPYQIPSFSILTLALVLTMTITITPMCLLTTFWDRILEQYQAQSHVLGFMHTVLNDMNTRRRLLLRT